jgi:hypothetical protein
MSKADQDATVDPKAESGVDKPTPDDLRRQVGDSFEQVQVEFGIMSESADRYVELAIEALDAAKIRRESGAPSANDLVEARELEELASQIEHREGDLRQRITDLRGKHAEFAQKATYAARRLELAVELIGVLRSAAAGGNIDVATVERLESAMRSLDLELADL